MKQYIKENRQGIFHTAGSKYTLYSVGNGVTYTYKYLYL